MLKTVLILISLVISVKSFAIDLNCEVVPAKNTELIAKNFSISDVGTPHTDISFDGGLFEGPSIENDTVVTKYSNECDNMITIVFNSESLNKLQLGQINKIKGLIHYSSLDVEDILLDTDFVEAEIDCSKIGL